MLIFLPSISHSTPEHAIKRIITLSPHATELVFSAGSGHLLVGRDKNSNYPAEVIQLPSVGDAYLTDLEAIVQLQPDLIVLWQSGSHRSLEQQLKQLGLRIFISEPHNVQMIAEEVRQIGKMAGTTSIANKAADDFIWGMNQLKQQYAHRRKLSVFYQVWHQPLITLNKQHFVSQILHICGATNVFSDLPNLAPKVSLEAVIQANPDIIISPDNHRSHWLPWHQINAVKAQQFIQINPDWMQRPSFRLLKAAKQICQQIDPFRH